MYDSMWYSIYCLGFVDIGILMHLVLINILNYDDVLQNENKKIVIFFI